jgi:hypothetical protein
MLLDLKNNNTEGQCMSDVYSLSTNQYDLHEKFVPLNALETISRDSKGHHISIFLPASNSDNPDSETVTKARFVKIIQKLEEWLAGMNLSGGEIAQLFGPANRILDNNRF